MSISPLEKRQVRLTQIVFYYDSTIQPLDCDVNRVLVMMRRLQELGVNVKIVDMAGRSDEERTSVYFDAVTGAVIQQAAIRQVFGSRRTPALLFARQVPALLVYDQNYVPPICVDVYPQKRSLIDGTRRSIESYLDDALRTLELSAAYSQHLDEAKLALENRLYRAAVLYAVLAIDGFVWRALWGQKDITWIGVDDRRHKWSSIDFVYEYALRSRSDFPYPQQFEKLKERNKSLFRKLKDSDSFLLGQAVKLGIVKDGDKELVSALRTVRNFCAHFNPYEVTVSRYRTALHKLGITDQTSFADIERVAKATVEKAVSILWSWAYQPSIRKKAG